MKKLTTLIIACALLFSLAACGNSPKDLSSYEKYIKASEALSEAGSISANMDMVMSVDYDGEALEMEMSGTVKEVINSETDIDLEMLMTTTTMGESLETNVYYKGGTYYMDMLGMKYSMPMPIDEVMSQTNLDPIEFMETAIKEESATDVDGGTEIRFLVDGSTLNELLADTVNSSMEGMLGQMEDLGATVTYGDMELTVLLDKDGNMKTMRMAFPYEMTMTDEEDATMTIKFSMDMTMEILQLGGVTIEFPDDLDSYLPIA